MFPSPSRLAFEVAAVVTAGIVGLAGIGFLLFAAFLALRDTYTPSEAAALTGIGAVVLSALIALATRICRHRRRPPRDFLGSLLSLAGDNLEGDRGTELAALIGKQAANWIHGNPAGTSLAAAVIGFLLGASPALRRALGDLIKPE